MHTEYAEKRHSTSVRMIYVSDEARDIRLRSCSTRREPNLGLGSQWFCIPNDRQVLPNRRYTTVTNQSALATTYITSRLQCRPKETRRSVPNIG